MKWLYSILPWFTRNARPYYQSAPMKTYPPTANEDFRTWFGRQQFRNFQADELTWYFSKVRNGVRNTFPPRASWVNIVPTLRILDDLRDHFGKPLTISSSFRALPYNRAIGSPDGSLHPQFKAIDFTVQDVPPSKVFATLSDWRSNGSFKGGLGSYPNFTHLDTRSNNATW
jgi:uncharacterized protein YcbK (DUF882 family)